MEKKIDTRTASQRIDADIISLIKSKHTLIWIVTRDERRVESALAEIAYRAKLALNIWDCSQGLYTQQTSGKMEVTDDSVRDSMSMLTKIRQTPKRCLYVMRDLHKWLADPYVLRALRTLSRDLQDADLLVQRSIVVLSPSSEVPLELSAHAIVVDYPLPDRAEMGKILDDVVSVLPEEMKGAALTAALRETAVDAAIGLSAEEAANVFS